MTPERYAKLAHDNMFKNHRSMFIDDGNLVLYSNIGDSKGSRTEATRLRKHIESEGGIVHGPAWHEGYTWVLVVPMDTCEGAQIYFDDVVHDAWIDIVEAMRDGGLVQGQPVCWQGAGE